MCGDEVNSDVRYGLAMSLTVIWNASAMHALSYLWDAVAQAPRALDEICCIP